MRTQTAEPSTRIQTRNVRVPIPQAYLEGELSIPSGAAGIVLFAHGSGSSRNSPRNRLVAQTIRESGNGTFLFDLLRPAEEIEDNVTGALRFNMSLLARRLVAVTRWIQNQADTEHMKLGLFSSSTAGGAALVAAADLGKVIEAVVSRSGRPDLAGSALTRVESPTLLIVGDYDEVAIRLNEEALAKMHCEKALKIVPRGVRLLEDENVLTEVAKLAASWFQDHLNPHEASQLSHA